MKKYWLPLVALAWVATHSSCTQDKALPPRTPECIGVNPVYEPGVKSILNTYCNVPACHDAATAKVGVDFSTYEKSKNVFETEDVICALKQTECIPMPQGGPKLADSLIHYLECWASNNYQQQ